MSYPRLDGLDAGRGPIGLKTLNYPSDPYFDIIFVHGLMGDSYWTWTVENDKATFWPEWLIEDKVFINTRIHTYGYHEPAVYGRVPVGKLRDIGTALCTALELNNHVRGAAHAIINAKQNVQFQELGRRFHTVLFLATPHRDAEDRDMLRNILKSCNTSAASRYDPVDPDPNTKDLQEINNNFYSYSQDLRMWSFYETSTEPLVNKRRAVLNPGQDREVRVNATHAGVAKYRTTSDPTYSSIREILLSLVIDIQEELLNPERVESDMRILATYLGIHDTEDDDITRREQRKAPKSCEWLLRKPNFTRWRDREGSTRDKRRQIYWLKGDPGCGKSFIAAHVVNNLREHNYDLSSYFLKHGDISKDNIGGLLRSIAYQMARTSASLRRSLLSMQKEDTLTSDPSDLRAIWKQLFVQRVFRADIERHQYWVIDALDEAHANHELFNLLKGLPEGYSVFLTSRKDQELERTVRRLDMNIETQYVEKEDTLQDIHLYLQHNEADLHADDAVQMQTLIQKLVDKSRGNFLWTHLIVQQLAYYWTEEDFMTVLRDVPDGMQHLYTRILRKIASTPNAPLAKAILRWVICAVRPMTVTELRTAIRLNAGRTLRDPAEAIARICEPLVSVGYGCVEVVHDTVRDFLFNRARRPVSELVQDFVFDKPSSHEELAIISVDFMNKSFRAPLRRPSLESASASEDHAFLAYASKNFSDHVVKSASAEESSNTRKLLDTLLDFLQGPVLFWVQSQAQQRSLSTVTRAGKNLKSFATKRGQVHAQPNKQLHEVQDWANDLIHLVTAFGKDLLREPSAINTVIPSLCPPQSMLYAELRNPDAGLQVVGLSKGSWPDQINSVSFGNDYVNALACCDRFYAVGLRSNQIVLFNANTCQESRRIKTNEQVMRLEFAHSKEWLVASGRTLLTMYNFESGEEIWTSQTSNIIVTLAMSVDDTLLFAATRAKVFETFNPMKGDRIESRYLEGSKPGRALTQICISDEMKLVALLHRNEELELYDMHSLQRPKKGRIGQTSGIETMAFNPALNMLAMGSFDGELCTVELFSMKKVQTADADASHLAVSIDGKTLIVGCKPGGQGDVQIRSFESLALLQQIRYDDAAIMDLCFTSNSLRFLDIRRKAFNVWEPATLVRRRDDEDSGGSGGSDMQSTFSTAPTQPFESLSIADESSISALVEHHSGDFVFCAKEDGTVAVYETANGRLKQKLFDFGRTVVLFMAWNQHENLLVTADNSSTVKVYKISVHQEGSSTGHRQSWKAKECGRKTLKHPIRQVLASGDGEILLVSTTTRDYFFDRNCGTVLLTHDCPSSSERSQRWANHPRRRRQFLEISAGECHRVVWDRDEPEKPHLEHVEPHEIARVDTSIFNGHARLVGIGGQVWAAQDHNPNTGPFVWSQPSKSLALDDSPLETTLALREFDNSAAQVGAIMGVYHSKLVFISHDNWICSTKIVKGTLDDPIRYHFPMPHYWRGTNRNLLALVSSKGDIVIAINSDLAVIKHGW